MSNENENSLDEAFDEIINTNDEDFGLNDETFTETEDKVARIIKKSIILYKIQNNNQINQKEIIIPKI